MQTNAILLYYNALTFVFYIPLLVALIVFYPFTGLAYIDLKNLTYDHIVTTPTGEQYIYNRRQKTGTPYHIMLLPIAQELIERYRGYPGKIDETRVFPVKDRKSMCTTIKRIAQKCGITKNLSTHVRRHNKNCIFQAMR